MSQQLFAFVEGEMTTIVRNRQYGYHFPFGESSTLCGLSGRGLSNRVVHRDAATEMVRCPKCIASKKRIDAMDHETDWRPNEMMPEDFHA